MIPAELAAAWEASWPAAGYAQIGGFRVGQGLGGGARVGSARATGAWDEADLAAVEAQHAAWGQPAVFAVGRGDNALDGALTARGYRRGDSVRVIEAPVAALTDRPIPPVTALESWPPLAIQRDLWAEQGIGPERQAVMDRVRVPCTAILGRTEDRAAGVGFVAVHGPVAMLHALAVLPRWRRKGLAGWIIRRAGDFAVRHGATRLVLAVSEGNEVALAMYDALGFAPVARYDYRVRD